MMDSITTAAAAREALAAAFVFPVIVVGGVFTLLIVLALVRFARR